MLSVMTPQISVQTRMQGAHGCYMASGDQGCGMLVLYMDALREVETQGILFGEDRVVIACNVLRDNTVNRYLHRNRSHIIIDN